MRSSLPWARDVVDVVEHARPPRTWGCLRARKYRESVDPVLMTGTTGTPGHIAAAMRSMGPITPGDEGRGRAGPGGERWA